MDKIVRIALVIKTLGLEYDDRVRKEILSIQGLFPNIRFKIFAMLPENKRIEGVTDYGVPFCSVYVPARDKYPSAQKALLKAWQFQRAIEGELKTFDAVWCANDDTLVTVALTSNKRTLWDLHEIPATLTGSSLRRSILKYLFSRCKVVIHANPQRRAYLESLGLLKRPDRHYALRNYPNFDDEDKEYDEKYNSFLEWKKDRKCIYLQGLADERRAAYESVKAVMDGTDLCAVVVGGFHKPSKERLINEYGQSLNERILFIGQVPQMKIPQYVKQCFISMVFYKNVSPNNWFCEANRFYQSVILGLPVVTGFNPSMRELIDQYGFGVSIEDDGSHIDKIVEGINQLLNNYDIYHNNTLKYRDQILWNKQETILKELVEKLISDNKNEIEYVFN